MSEEKLVRYFIGDREVSWNEYCQTEGGLAICVERM